MTFGSADFMRVPLPAARMIAAIWVVCFEAIEMMDGNPDGAPPFGGRQTVPQPPLSIKVTFGDGLFQPYLTTACEPDTVIFLTAFQSHSMPMPGAPFG
jgi:hypothetical protein